MGILEIENKSGFDEALRAADDSLVVIDFFATWCGPCKRLTPQLVELSTQNPTVKFYKMDVDKNGEISKKYKISAMPTILFIKNGRVVKKVVGANMPEILSALKKYA